MDDAFLPLLSGPLAAHYRVFEAMKAKQKHISAVVVAEF